jgi:elongation factor 2
LLENNKLIFGFRQNLVIIEEINMVKKEVTSVIKELMRRPEQIRNIGIVAHIDHGKTTLTDNLLAGAGMISEELAGKQLAMDFVEQEQERGITIYSANVSMVHEVGGREYLINLIDTPGHVDFGGDVTRAMRAVDGVVVVIDAVEAVMPQTETVVRQALKERVRPILFINKVDRLIKELKLTPEQMQERFRKIITEVNMLIHKYGEKEYADKWTVSVNDGSVAFGSAVKNWAISIPYMQKTGITFKDVIELTNKGEEGEKELARKAPLHVIVLDMVIKHLPNPLQAQPYRIPKIWPGDKESEVAKDMEKCNPDGKLAGVVTKLYPDPHAGYVATVRIFSGKLTTGQEVYLVGQHKIQKLQQVSVYKGQQRINMDEVDAGNIVGIVGLKDAFSGETICDPEEKIPGFESIKHIFEPVVTKAIEPKQPKQLAKLIEFLRRVAKEDPTLRVKINEETGEYLVSGLGELHINAKIERPLKEAEIDVDVSPPIVIYRECVRSVTPQPIEGKSPNKHNKFYLVVEPLEPGVYQAMVRGEIADMEVKKKMVELQNKLVDLGFDREESKKVKLIHNKNILLDMTRGVHAILEVMEMIKQSFMEAMDEGPLAREPCMRVKVKLVDAKLHEDAIHRGPAQVIPAVRFAIREAMIQAKAYILEPKQIIRIDVPTEQVSGAMKEVQNRRGQILEMTEERGTTSIKAKLPVADMFGFNSSLKSSTSGQGFYWLIDIVYEPLPRDLEQKVINQIKQRKGLAE